MSKNLIKKKRRLQNRALKLIYSHERDFTIEDLHIKANLTSISQQADKQILCMMYKISHNETAYPHS